MTVYGGTNQVSGYASPGTIVHVNLRTAAGVYKGTAADIADRL